MGVVKTQVQGVRLRGVWLVCQTLRRGRVEKHDAAAIAQGLKGKGDASRLWQSRHHLGDSARMAPAREALADHRGAGVAEAGGIESNAAATCIIISLCFLAATSSSSGAHSMFADA